MENKMVEENLCYALIDEIEKINKEGNKESELKKREILERNFKMSFQKISDVIDNELNEKFTLQKKNNILNLLEEIFENSRNEINSIINNIYKENDSTYSIVALLNNKVENLLEIVKDIKKDNEGLDKANEAFMSKMNEMEYGLSDERQYATSVINNSISQQLEEKIVDTLEQDIKSVFLQNNINEQGTLDELEYQIKYILNLELKTKTLDEFYNVDTENVENIQSKEVVCFKEVKKNCIEILKSQVQENLEEIKKKSDTLDLSNLVNDEEQAGIQTDLREKKEKDDASKIQEDVIDLPSNIII